MTGTEKILEKIIQDAKARALAIEEQAGQEAGAIMDQASQEAGLKRAELLERAQADGAQSYKRLIAVAGLEGRKELLRAKQDVIDTAFARALDKVCGLPDSEYQKLLEDLIADAVDKDGGEILLSEKDAKRLDSKFISNINQRLRASGKGGSVKLSSRYINTAGGFVLKIGDMEINSTFEILFGMLRTELENEVVKMLFSD
ncbi:MAG: V-type ATP synthase subunit E [Clostridiaceae bacterium]|nr:V-type ATP synthase subunit E [Clostridiaceae bacterium]